jgi:hypothetical protein
MVPAVSVATSIKIGAISYSVSEAPIRECGLIDYDSQTICLRDSLGKDTQAVTLWHEIIHGILYNMGQTNHDEILVDGIAHGIVQVLNDNPHLRGKRNG